MVPLCFALRQPTRAKGSRWNGNTGRGGEKGQAVYKHNYQRCDLTNLARYNQFRLRWAQCLLSLPKMEPWVVGQMLKKCTLFWQEAFGCQMALQLICLDMLPWQSTFVQYKLEIIFYFNLPLLKLSLSKIKSLAILFKRSVIYSLIVLLNWSVKLNITGLTGICIHSMAPIEMSSIWWCKYSNQKIRWLSKNKRLQL